MNNLMIERPSWNKHFNHYSKKFFINRDKSLSPLRHQKQKSRNEKMKDQF